jgi:uncharacterized protein YutE (UPF0331/DUF86 family)
MDSKRQKIITCLGISSFYPIVDLYNKLDKTNFMGSSSKIKKSMTESGYSCAIILQVAMIIESLTGRVRYLCRTKYRNKKKIKILDFLEKYFIKEKQLIDEVREIFILRDAIVHNHLWTISWENDEDFNEVKTYHRLLKIYGDDKFNDNIDRKTRTTKKLKLNVVPIKIGKEDVKTVFGVLKEFCDLVDKKHGTSIKNFYTKWDNQTISLIDFLKKNS